MRLLTFTCPLCGAAGQRFPLLSASRRQAKTACRGCGVMLRSDPRLGLHTLYLLYTQIIVLLAALPMIWAYALGRWFWLAVIWAGAGVVLVPRRNQARTKSDHARLPRSGLQLRAQAGCFHYARCCKRWAG